MAAIIPVIESLYLKIEMAIAREISHYVLLKLTDIVVMLSFQKKLIKDCVKGIVKKLQLYQS